MEHWNDKDKLMHASVCAVISLYSTECAIFASLAKEYGDKGNPYNHWCWKDLAADMVGIIIGTAIRLIIAYLIFHTFRWNWI